jgi:hypothetical protein
MPTNNTNTTTTQLKNSDSKTDHMKIHISNHDLLKGIQTVQSAISVRSTLPVLSNILFQATEKGLRLSATDLEVGIRTWIKADVLQQGAVTVPAKIISDFLKTIEGDKEIKKLNPLYLIEIPKVMEIFSPLLTIIPLQLIAYCIAREFGEDIDQPRNLAKSVTVE